MYRANKKLEKDISATEKKKDLSYPTKCHIIQIRIIKRQSNSHLFKIHHFTEEKVDTRA